MGKIYDKFKETARNNKGKIAIQTKENGKWKKIRYIELLKLVDNLASSLVGLDIEKSDRIIILSENRWEWLCTDLAINKIGAISVPIHAVSNQDTIEYILRDSESAVLFVSEELLEKNRSFFLNHKDLEDIIVFSDKKDYVSDKITFFNNLTEKNSGKSRDEQNQIASIIYTSGTTGEPKGVMLSDDNFLSNIEPVLKRIKVYPKDIFLSFLPLSHVLERTAGSYVPILSGASVAYCPDIKKLSNYFNEIQPSLIIAVPKIFEKTYDKIFAGLKEKSVIFKKIFFFCLKTPKNSVRRKIVDKIILSKLRKKIFGSRLRFAISGGASINEKILKFFQNIGVDIIQGYGLTETSPIIAVNSLQRNRLGTVGTPLEGVEVKVARDKEIKVKGKNVMKGYWRKDNLTDEVLADGWFSTGDLGFLDNDNYLTIIGRKKEMIVTSNGKNIYPERIENIINLNIFIEQSLVVGHKKEYLACLIVPDKKIIEEKYGPCEKKLIKEIIEHEIEKENNKLEKHEQIKKIKILDKSFSIESGELTPTLKVRRKIIEAEYKDLIEKIYKEKERI